MTGGYYPPNYWETYLSQHPNVKQWLEAYEVHNRWTMWFEKEYFMSKKIEITKTALDETYKKGCSDVKDTLKNLFPDYEFEKEIESNTIYKRNGEFYRLTCFHGGKQWSLVCLNTSSPSWSGTELREDIKDIINDEDFTLCPNAKIRVDND